MKELLNKIESLEKRIKILESNKNESYFGKSYSQIGDTKSDFLIKTRGQVKIQWGSKFIDLLKDGKINCNLSFIYQSEKVGSKDGIYVTSDDKITLKVGDKQLELSSNDSYISFLEKQELSSEQKYQALQNIGFIYNDLESVNNAELKNGIVYIEQNKKLYIITDGKLQEFSFSFPDSISKPFIISKEDNTQGALIIKGFGSSNSLKFDKMYIYNDISASYISSENIIKFLIQEKEILTISDNDIQSNVTLKADNISSKEGKFKLYINNGKSILEVDQIIENNSKSSIQNIYPIQWFLSNNIISSIYEDDDNYIISFIFNNTYKVGDILLSYAIFRNSDDEYVQINPAFEVIEVIEDSVKVTIADSSYMNQETIDYLFDEAFINEFILKELNKQQIFLIRTDKSIPKISSNGFELLKEDKVITKIGNLSEDQEGLYSYLGMFQNLFYTSDYNLSLNEDSSKVASTEWTQNLIRNLLPIGTIVAFKGDTIPQGWHICDGQEGTPDLRDKYIKGRDLNSSNLEGGSDQILLDSTNLTIDNVKYYQNDNVQDDNGNWIIMAAKTMSSFTPLEKLPVKIEPKYYSLVFIMKIK